MNDETMGSLDTLVQEKLEADIEFQESIADLEENDAREATEKKRKEILEQEFSAIKSEADKKAELAENYKKRAEKAEKGEKKGDAGTSKDPAPKSDENLSPKDLYALMNAKVAETHVDEVVKMAKLLGVSVTEALKDESVKVRLNTLVEQDKVAEATNTKTSRPSTKAVSGTDLMNKASKGEFPDKGTKEAEELFWARRGGKK